MLLMWDLTSISLSETETNLTVSCGTDWTRDWRQGGLSSAMVVVKAQSAMCVGQTGKGKGKTVTWV